MKPIAIADMLNLDMGRPKTPQRLAAMLLLSVEIEALRNTMGFAGSPAWYSFSESTRQAAPPSWAAWAKKTFGVSAASALRHWQGSRVVQARLREQGHAEAASLLDERPSNLTREQTEALLVQIQRHGLRECDTAASLQREFQGLQSASPAVEAPQRRWSPSPLDIVLQAEAIKGHAVALGLAPGVAGRVAMMILCRDFAETGSGRNIIRYWKRKPSAGESKNLEFPPK